MSMNLTASVVQLDIPIVFGRTLPANHGYALYAAISAVLDSHLPDGVAIGSIPGIRSGEAQILVAPGAHLHVRVPAEAIPAILPLAGQELDVGDHRLVLGIPKVRGLEPCTAAKAYMVTIKGFLEPEPLLEAARRQASALGINARLVVPNHPTGARAGQPMRRVLRVRNHTVVGFAVEALDLSHDDSLKILAFGLGGRRHMGCGVFFPLAE